MLESISCIVSIIIGFALFLKLCHWLGTYQGAPQKYVKPTNPAMKVAAYNAVVKHRHFNNWWKFP